MLLRGGKNQVAPFIENLAHFRLAEDAKVLRQIGRAEGQRIDAVSSGDRVKIVERFVGFEHYRNVHLVVGELVALDCRFEFVLARWAGAGHAAIAAWRIVRRVRDLASVSHVFHLGAVQVPHAAIEQPRDPFAVGMGWAHGDGKLECTREDRHVGETFDRQG